MKKVKPLDPGRMRRRQPGEKLLIEQHADDEIEHGEEIADENLRLALLAHAEARRVKIH